MELNEMEKRVLYQTEGREWYAALHELAMASRYAKDPDRRKAADRLIKKLNSLTDGECMEIVYDMKKDWLVMLDILANKKEIPCSRTTLVRLKNAARDAYGKAEEADKPQLAGIAAKISCFLEAVDKKGLSGILRDDSILFSEKTELPPFLSKTEKERFRHIYEAGAKELELISVCKIWQI